MGVCASVGVSGRYSAAEGEPHCAYRVPFGAAVHLTLAGNDAAGVFGAYFAAKGSGCPRDCSVNSAL